VPEPPPAPLFLASAAAFGAWLERHAATADELLVGFWKQGTGHPTLSWNESVDEALCHGWIDGIRRSVDADRYSIRFTPRRARSKWSAKNIARIEELRSAGRMRPAGIAAFDGRVDVSAGYSFERGSPASLPVAYRDELEAAPAALAFFETQPAGYRNGAIHWVMSAKRDETRQRRLRTLIEDSTNEERIKQLRARPRNRDASDQS